MKKLMITMGIVLGLCISNSTNAQIYVKIRPIRPAVVVVKPAAPSPRHVWVEGEWHWNKRQNQYVWREGYWAEPPKPGRVWIEGRWEDGPQGSRWVHGHWGRR